MSKNQHSCTVQATKKLNLETDKNHVSVFRCRDKIEPNLQSQNVHRTHSKVRSPLPAGLLNYSKFCGRQSKPPGFSQNYVVSQQPWNQRLTRSTSYDRSVESTESRVHGRERYKARFWGARDYSIAVATTTLSRSRA